MEVGSTVRFKKDHVDWLISTEAAFAEEIVRMATVVTHGKYNNNGEEYCAFIRWQGKTGAHWYRINVLELVNESG